MFRHYWWDKKHRNITKNNVGITLLERWERAGLILLKRKWNNQSMVNEYSSYFRLCGMLNHFSHVWLCATVWTIAHQDPLSMGFSQARILEWVAVSSSRGSSWPRDQTHVSYIYLHCEAGSLSPSASWEAPGPVQNRGTNSVSASEKIVPCEHRMPHSTCSTPLLARNLKAEGDTAIEECWETERWNLGRTWRMSKI